MKFQSSIKYIKLRKIIIITFLLIILFAICAYYNSNYKTNVEYYSSKSILSNYSEDHMFYTTGKVTGIYKGGFYLSDMDNGKKIVYKINSSYKVDVNDSASVLGVLGPSYNIKASKVSVSKKWKEDFLFVRSAIGGIILLFIFLKFWKFDFKSMEFIKRK